MSRLLVSFFFATLLAVVRAQETTPKQLPCSLPAPTSSTPAVKAGEPSSVAGWSATGGNEASKLSDMSAQAFEKWLKEGSPGAASADSAASACDSKNVAKYTIDVKSACKKVDDAATAGENGGGLQYALEYTVSYGCRARAQSAKKSTSSDAVAAAPASAASSAPSGPVKIEATLRTLVSQPPLKESSDGSLVRPKPSVGDVWFVQGTAETSKVVEKTVKKSIGGDASGASAAAGAPAPSIISTEEKEVAPVGSALASAFGGSSSSGSSSTISETISSVGAALASALDAAAGADARVGDALDAAAADYRDSYYGGAPRGGAVIITSPVGMPMSSGFEGSDDDEMSFGGNNNDDDDFRKPVAATMMMKQPSSSSSSSVLSRPAGSESAAEEGKRIARETAAAAANPIAAAKPE